MMPIGATSCRKTADIVKKQFDISGNSLICCIAETLLTVHKYEACHETTSLALHKD